MSDPSPIDATTSPAAAPEGAPPSVDPLDALTIPVSVKWGGAACMVAALFTLALALQTAMVFELSGPIAPFALAALSLLGVMSLGAGWRMIWAGGPAAVVGAATAGVLWLAGSGWAVYSFAHGVASLLSVVVPMCALGATILAAVSIGPARRAHAAHAALEREGLALRASPFASLLARPRVTVGIAIAIASLVFGVVAWRRAHRPFDPLATPYGAVLGQKLTDYVVAHGEDRAAIHRELTSDATKKAIGPELTNALGALLDRGEALGSAPLGDKATTTAAVDGFLVAASGVEDALRASNLPVFIDVDVLHGRDRVQPLLLSYYVEREASFDAGGTLIRTQHLWRLDRLRVSLPFLGYTRPRTSSALVLLDTIETDLVTGIIPALKPGEHFSIVQETNGEPPAWATALETLAGEKTRAELAAEVNDPRFARLATLLAERRKLVRKWAVTLPQLGLTLRVPERYVPEAKYEDELAHRVPRADLDEWRELHDELMTSAMLDAFVAMRRRVVGAIERHEVQHRIDYASGLLAVPPDVAQLLGVENPLGVAATSMPGRVRDELSAYLAQIGTAGTPLLDLVLLSRALFRDSVDPYTYAAWAALLGIGRELGVDTPGIIGGGRVRPEHFARALTLVLAKSPAEIGAAALRLRRAAYGTDLPEVRLLNAIDHATWRR